MLSFRYRTIKKIKHCPHTWVVQRTIRWIYSVFYASDIERLKMNKPCLHTWVVQRTVRWIYKLDQEFLHDICIVIDRRSIRITKTGPINNSGTPIDLSLSCSDIFSNLPPFFNSTYIWNCGDHEDTLATLGSIPLMFFVIDINRIILKLPLPSTCLKEACNS